MGSAAVYHLAKAGCRVLGLDRYRPPHTLGSSHGLSRIIREAYFEDPSYVPLVQRAYQLWAELEQRAGRRLLLPTGGLMIGPPDGALVSGAKRSAQQHRLAYELLSAPQLPTRFPAFRPPEPLVAVAEPRAGVLFPELAVETHLELAVQAKASLHFEEPIISWRTDGAGVEVSTSRAKYRADRLVLSAGPWLASLLRDLDLPLTVERQVLLWFEPASQPELFEPARFPIFIWQYSERGFFYGFPNLGDGVKVALHHEGRPADAEAAREEVTAADITPVRDLLRRFIPDANGPLKSSAACLYTNAPDEHFIFGLHPDHPGVLIVSPCSGHGFKFSPVIGELTAAMVCGKEIPFDLSLFAPTRFAHR